MSPVNKLCCVVNPCYVCEACNFKECTDHWLNTLANKDFHFDIIKGVTHTCKTTGIEVANVWESPTEGTVIYATVKNK